VTEARSLDELSGAFALLADMTQSFASSQDLRNSLERALTLVVSHLDAVAGSLWLVDPNGAELECYASVGPNQITGMRLPVSQGIIGKSVRENLCQRVLDVSQHPDFSGFADEKSGFATRSLLCAPMSFTDKPIGAIEVLNKRSSGGHFVDADGHLLQVLASSAALAVANARMAESLVEHERTRRELELAAEIQRSLLPAREQGPYPIYGVNVPKRTVSGDFFDILPLPNGTLGFCLGDVSGKGMNAALLMAKSASLYRCMARHVERPGRLLGVLNREICETVTRGMFVTMVAGIFDPATGVARLANAGHEPPLHRDRDGGFRSFPAEAPPLGIDAGEGLDRLYPEVEVEMGEGALYVCSDGLTEACSESGGFLGPEGVMGLIDRYSGKPLAERVEAIVSHVSQRELRDDLTLLVVDASRR
jgi:sigma-B regulation protein RsbU (phosphoserine phosphatase)